MWIVEAIKAWSCTHAEQKKQTKQKITWGSFGALIWTSHLSSEGQHSYYNYRRPFNKYRVVQIMFRA